MTQSDLAELLGTSQGAVTRIEQGKQNLSLDMLAKIGDALDSEFVSLGHSGPQHLRIVGGQKLTGSIDVKTSKNAAVALLCAALLNRGRTTLRNLARIEAVNRTLEPHMAALRSFGLEVTATHGFYEARSDRTVGPERAIVRTERGDTVTENALMAAARHAGTTIIRNA